MWAVSHLPSGRATLTDVARLAEVDTKTVSRALSGSRNVDPETRARIERAAATLRFRPNALARELRTGGVTNAVGFVIGDLTNPFYSLVAAGVERVLARDGMTLVIAASDDESRLEPTVVSAMLERRIRGLLLVPITDDHSYLDSERHFGTPIVAVDRPLSNATSDTVVLDNRAGALAGVLALLDAGHTRVAFVGSADTLYTHHERLLGYRDALAARGVASDPDLIRMDAPDIASAAASVASAAGFRCAADSGVRRQQPCDHRSASGHPAAGRPRRPARLRPLRAPRRVPRRERGGSPA